MRRTALSTFLFLLLAAMLFTGCSVKEKIDNSWVPAGMKLLENSNVDYTVYVPENWKIDLSSGVSTAYDEKTHASVSIVAFNLEKDMLQASVDTYWDYYVKSLTDSFPDFAYVTEADTEAEDFVPGESTVLDQTAAKCYTYTCTITGTKYQFLQCICIRGGYVYMITYTATPDNFSTHLDDIYNIIGNFKFGSQS